MARITTWRTRWLSDVLFCSVSCKSKKLDEIEGLKSIGLNGPISLPSSSWLLKGTALADGILVPLSRWYASFCAGDSADGSNKGRRPPNVSVCADTVDSPIVRRVG